MINQFGRFLRDLRHSNTELLKDMAENLNVSPAFLSAVEAGKKSIPPTLVAQVGKFYRLPRPMVAKMQEAVDASQRAVTIDLNSASAASRGVAVAFARQFNSLTEAELEQLRITMEAVRKRAKDD